MQENNNRKANRANVIAFALAMGAVSMSSGQSATPKHPIQHDTPRNLVKALNQLSNETSRHGERRISLPKHKDETTIDHWHVDVVHTDTHDDNGVKMHIDIILPGGGHIDASHIDTHGDTPAYSKTGIKVIHHDCGTKGKPGHYDLVTPVKQTDFCSGS